MSNSTTAANSVREGSKVTVTPEEFKLVNYDAGEIASVVADLAERLGVANPIRVVVDETTPLARMTSSMDGTSSDSTITIHVESGALEDTRHPTNFGRDQAALSLGRMMLRARDRMRPDFADAPDDGSLTMPQEAAWNTYVVGRLERLGIRSNPQRWRYNYRNRFGFSDAADTRFDQLWAADDLGWAELDQPV